MKNMFNKIKLFEDKILSIVFGFLIIFIPLREIIAKNLSNYVKAIPDIIIFILLIYTLIKKGRKIKISKTEIFLGLFIITAFISTLFVNDMGIKSFILECRSMLLYYILYFIIRNSELKEKDFNLFLKALQVILVVISMFAIVEVIFDKEVLFPLAWKEKITSKNNFPRVYSFFNNPNTFAFFNFLSFIILTINIKKIDHKVYFSLIVLVLTNIWLSGSRSTMLILLFYIFMIFIKYYKKLLNKNILLKYATIFITTILVILSINLANDCIKKVNNVESELISEKIENELIAEKPDEISRENQKSDKSIMLSRILKIFSGEYFKNSKTDGRMSKVSKGFEILREHILIGSGFGSFGDAASLMNTPDKIYEKYDIDYDFYADNEFMKNLVETGVIGFSFFMAFIVFMIMRYKEDYIKVLTFICVCLFGLFTNVFEIQIITFLLVIILSLIKGKDSLNV